MTDLPDLTSVDGQELNEQQLHGILAQIDLDIVNLLRDGKLAALKYKLAGPAPVSTDRAANLKSLLEARRMYRELLESSPGWTCSQAELEGT